MEARVQKWGHSLALRIPKPFAAEIGIEPNSPVDVVVVDRKLIVTPIAEPGLTLAQLLAQVNETNLHGEVDSGPAVGNEAW